MSLQSQRHQTLKAVMPMASEDLLGLVQVEQRGAGAHVASHRRHEAADVVDVTMAEPSDHLPGDEDPAVLEAARLGVLLTSAQSDRPGINRRSPLNDEQTTDSERSASRMWADASLSAQSWPPQL